MCGIAGVYRRDNKEVSRSALEQMCRSFQHRGPDGEGYYFAPGFGMGMRRLSIIDLSGGDQPLYNEDKSLALVFNGEIYNYIELRKDLIARGHRFHSGSDGEAILHLYEEKGLACLDDLNGMYAFCLWDAKKHEGYLVRDRIGIKPVYYAEGEDFRFASELKALLAVMPRPEPDWSALERYLAFMYIPGDATPFHGVRKLPRASYVRFGKGGISRPIRYWAIPREETINASEDHLREEFYHLMESSIELQSRSDVPVGVFLSGGLDSSLITAFFSKHTKSEVHSFNVKYGEGEFDESRYAEMVAKRFGCRHHSVAMDLRTFLADLPKLIWHMDEPSADHALVAAYKVSELASRDVKVVLNGSGGDELFGGYTRYLPNAAPLKAWHALSPVLQSMALPFADAAGDTLKKARYNRNPDDTYLWRLMQFKPYHLDGFHRGRPYLYERDPLLEELLKEAPKGDLNRYLYLDANFYLVDDLLLLLDKMTMAASVEGRVPLLDHRLVEWAFRLKGSEKVKGGETKYCVKRWLKGILPDEILFRKKLGFGAPVRDWMDQGLFDAAFRVLSHRPKSRADLFWGLKGKELRAKMETLNFQQNYAMLVLEIWFLIFIDGQSPAEISDNLLRGLD